jgi:hypothetical protein
MHLFHGSCKKKLNELRPREQFLFASHDIRVSSVFLVGAQRFACVKLGHVVYAFFENSLDEFLGKDRGGSIYVVRSEGFSPYPPNQSRAIEWTTAECVKPIKRIDYSSALSAMVRYGVKVSFVKPNLLDEIDCLENSGREVSGIYLEAARAGADDEQRVLAVSCRNPRVARGTRETSFIY